MSDKSVQKHDLKLLPEGYINLSSILKTFRTPLNEEPAWGILYQSSKTISTILKRSPEEVTCHLVKNIDTLFIHKDGYIHEYSFHQNPLKKSSSELQFVLNLAGIIFEALHFGLVDEEERNLSTDLRDLLDSMENVSGNSDEVDEGFEAEGSISFHKIMEICTKRLGSSYTGEKADLYYKDVCKALVSESIDLSTFLQRISQGPAGTLSRSRSNDKCDQHADLDQLNLNDWAKMWLHVVGQLRNGVQLKKVPDLRNTPVEYTLTPYEILMDGIKSKKYELKSVLVNGELPPRVKKTAHDLILNFIKSRPPLRNAQNRVLKPKPQKKFPYDLLMEDIRKEQRLKPTVKVAVKAQAVDHNQNLITTTKRRAIIPLPSDRDMTDSNMDQNPPQRRLIKADLDLLNSLDSKYDEYDDDDDDDDEDDDYSQQFYINLPDGSQSTPVTPFRRPDVAFSSVKDIKGLNLRRRHSISNPSNRGEHSSTMITFPFEYTNTLNAYTSLTYPKVSPILHRRAIPHSMSKSAIQEEFFQSNQWQTAIQCLSLNLEEVVHIRNVLTKAELESLPVECSLKEDVEKGKVCFLCMKTRFNLFCWGNACKLCKQIICSKCCQKMRIPLEHFAKIPVSSLSPILSPTVEEKEFPGSHHHHQEVKSLDNLSPSPRLDSLGNQSSGVGTSSNRASSAGDSNSERSNSPACLHDLDENDEANDHFPTTTTISTNNGPINRKKSQSFRNTNNGPLSLPSIQSLSMGLIAFKKKRADIRPLMVVCHDCRIMVLEIKRAAKEGHSLPPGIGKVLQNANLGGFNPSSLPTNVNNNVDLDMSFN